MMGAWSQWEGQVVSGEFHLRKYLGGSSQSGVFLTEHRGRGLQQAAIKLIPASATNKSLYLSRWSLAERLSHPHLIRLLQTGRCELGGVDLLFVVMEYAEENLAQILPERPLTPAEVRDLLEPTLDALTYLHSRGFVHGHLKPANLLAARDQLKLASDGLCGPGEATPAPEKLDAYDPPEKASGPASPAADVWSLGMTLTEALTQHLPSWSEKEQADPVLPENLPAPLSDIVRGCLRRDPQRRLTIADIAARLHPTQPLPQPPQPLPQSRATIQPVQGSPKLSLVVPAVIGVLLVAALFGGLRLLRRQPDSQQQAATKPTTQQESKPATSQATNQPPAGSRTKPSPASGQRQAPAITIHRGSENGPVANGSVIRKVLPDVPQTARNTIQGTIRVSTRVRVDPSGSVVGAEAESPGPSKYFARLATQAAQSWKFTPSSQAVERQFILSFDFKNTETTASATRVR